MMALTPHNAKLWAQKTFATAALGDTRRTQTLGLAHQEWWCRPDDPNDADEKESGKWQAASGSCRACWENKCAR
jgi:hypothetical protein